MSRFWHCNSRYYTPSSEPLGRVPLPPAQQNGDQKLLRLSTAGRDNLLQSTRTTSGCGSNWHFALAADEVDYC